MRRFPFDRAAVLKAAMEPLSESKWEDFLGCCWGKHARDKPFPRNPPKNAKKKPKPECFETGGALLWAVTKPLPESKSEKCLGRCWTEYARAGLSRKPDKKHVQKKPKPERLSLMECIAPCKAKPLH
jgi:hypothetical protein